MEEEKDHGKKDEKEDLDDNVQNFKIFFKQKKGITRR